MTAASTRLNGFSPAVALSDTDLVYVDQLGEAKATVAQFRTALAGNRSVETFVAGTNFTAGTTTSLTLAGAYGSINNIDVYCDGVPQLDCTLSGQILTFNPVIPAGTSQVVVKGGTARSIGVPADASVTTTKLAAQSVTPDKLNLIVANGGASDTQNTQIVRVANYSGGSYGYVNSALRVRTDVGTSANAFESAVAHILNNASTSSTSENFAELAQANKTVANAGGTWGRVTEVHEYIPTNDPSTPTIGHEIDVYANGTDATLNRVGAAIVSKAQTPSGAQCEVGIGLNFVNEPTDANPGKFHYGISFGRFGSTTKFNYGIDFTYATFETGGVPINMVSGQFIAFAPSRLFGYNSTALQYNTASGTVFQIQDNGNVQNVNNSYGAISDRRLKDNIEDIGDAIAKLRKIRVRQYDMSGVHHFGVVAQELRRVLPHLIEPFKRGKKVFFGVNYMGLMPWTVRAVQQVDEENRALAKRVARLEAQLARIVKPK